MGRLASAFVKLLTGSLAGQAIGFAVIALVARKVGPANLGAYGFASNLIGYFGLPVAGVGLLAVRDIARDVKSTRVISGRVVSLLALYGIAAWVAVYFLAPAISPTPLAASMLRILGAWLLLTLLSFEWVLQGLQAFGALALARLLGQVMYGIAAFAFITSGVDGLYRYAWLNVAGYAMTVVATWLYTFHSTGWPRLRFRVTQAARLFRRSAPFILSLVMIQIYFSADFVLLGFLSTSRSVGQYVVAYKLPSAFLGIASIWVAVFYPHAATQSHESLRRQIGLSTTVSLVLLIPLCAGSVVLGVPLIEALFGTQYGPAGTYFKVLMVAMLFGGVDANIGQVLLAVGDEGYFTRSVSVGAVINVAMNFLLIPPLGPTGSAIATVAAEAAVLAMMTLRLYRRVGAPTLEWPRIAAAAASSVVMGATLLLLFTSWPVAVRVLFGCAVFLTSATLTGAIRLSDRRYLRRAVRAA